MWVDHVIARLLYIIHRYKDLMPTSEAQSNSVADIHVVLCTLPLHYQLRKPRGNLGFARATMSLISGTTSSKNHSTVSLKECANMVVEGESFILYLHKWATCQLLALPFYGTKHNQQIFMDMIRVQSTRTQTTM